jgi:hypothetical protein
MIFCKTADLPPGIPDPYAHIYAVADAGAAGQLDYILNWYFLNAVVLGVIDDNYHRDPAQRADRRVDDIPASRWQPKLDFIGVNYYRSAYVWHDPFFAAKTGLAWGGAYQNDLRLPANGRRQPTYNLLNDLGWEIYPEGLYLLLGRLHAHYALPIMVTENGLPEDPERDRAAYTTAHLIQLARLQADGVNILGYLHWSIVDNWEWHEGYRSAARFGLFAIPGLNGTDGALPRVITDGAVALQHAIAESKVAPARVRARPAVERFGVITLGGDRVVPPLLSAGALWQGTVDPGPGLSGPVTLYLSRLSTGTLIGMVFYHTLRHWMRLAGVYWDGAGGILHFSHSAEVLSPSAAVPARVYQGTLNNQTFTGTIINHTAGLPVQTWSAAKNELHGAWNRPASDTRGTTLESLSISVLEGVVKAKYLLSVGNSAWVRLINFSVSASGALSGFSLLPPLSVRGQIAGAKMSTTITAFVPGIGVNLAWSGLRAPDGLPF